MSRNRHDRVTDHFGEDLDTNILLDGPVGDIPDGTVLHDALLLILAGGEIDEEVPPINWADPDLGTVIYIPSQPITIVQSKKVGFYNATFDSAPTPGNTIFCFTNGQQGQVSIPMDVGGLTTIGTTLHASSSDDDGNARLAYRDVQSGDPAGPYGTNLLGSNSETTIFEVSGLPAGGPLNYEETGGQTGTTIAESITPTGNVPAWLVGGFGSFLYGAFGGTPTFTPNANTTTIEALKVHTSMWGHGQAFYGESDGSAVTMGGTQGGTNNGATYRYCIVVAAFEIDETWMLGPLVQDDNESTYEAVTSATETLRVELASPMYAYEATVRVAHPSILERTYTLYGTNEADYSDLTELDTTEFASLGSYSPQDIDFGWAAAEAFQYYLLVDSVDGARRIHEFTLHALVGATTTSHPLTTNRDLLNQHPATAVSFDDDIAGLGEDTVQGALEKLSANSSTGSGVSAIIANTAVGVKFDFEMPFAGRITASRLLADTTGSIVLDLWKDSYPNYAPTVADSICGSAKPTISSSNKAQDTTLTGWTTDFNVGDLIRVNVDSVSTISRVTLALRLAPDADSPAISSIQLGRIDRTATIREPTLVYNQTISAGFITQTAAIHAPTIS